MRELFKQAVSHNWAFWICLGVSVFLLIGASFVPPLFVIDSSIIAAVGEMAGFCSLGALYKGLDRGIDATFKHHNTEITINNPDKVEEDNNQSATLQ